MTLADICAAGRQRRHVMSRLTGTLDVFHYVYVYVDLDLPVCASPEMPSLSQISM